MRLERSQARAYRPDHFLVDECGPCSICPNKEAPHKIVGCDGPPDAHVLLIGEKPAYNEDREGRPFVGRSGEELNLHYLPYAGLSRDHVMIANAVRCYAVHGGDNPSRGEALACASHHLPWLIGKLENLELIVTMGGPAYSLLGDEAPRPLDIQHGISIAVRDFLGTGSAIVVPTIHPAAGMHKPDEIGRIRGDFDAVREVLRGGWTGVDDEYPEVVYSVWDQTTPVEDEVPFIAIDTESDSGKPWCLTFSAAPGSGYMIRNDDREGLAAFAAYLSDRAERGRKVLLHYAAHDLPVLEEMGVHIPDEAVVDTMMLAYHRGLPQALKTLGWRLCGVDMRDYNDVVRPYAEAKMFSWVRRAAARLARLDVRMSLPWFLLETKTQQSKYGLMPPPKFKTAKTQNKHNAAWAEWLESAGVALEGVADLQQEMVEYVVLLARIGMLHERGTVAPWKRVMSIVNDAARGDDVRPFDRWEKIREKAEDVAERCEQLLGEPPSSGISEVPFDEALVYACADADVTRRAGLLMLEMKEARRI